MAQIRLFDGESIESALRRFKRQVQTEGILQDAKKKVFFLPPGERRKLKSKLARVRAKKSKRRR